MYSVLLESFEVRSYVVMLTNIMAIPILLLLLLLIIIIIVVVVVCKFIFKKETLKSQT
jgi:hypothetical protein